MKSGANILIIVAAILGWSISVHAFDSKTHKALTDKAISGNSESALDIYLREQLSMDEGLSALLSIDQSTILLSERIPAKQLEDRIKSEVSENSTILSLIKAGACLEDVPNPRAKHHFHDPCRNMGLENRTEHPVLASLFHTGTYVWYWGDNLFDLTGASAVKRMLGTEESKWQDEYENYFAWPDARYYFYKSLIDVNENAREHYLAITFLSFGHTVHLLEDMGVPPHTRNDFIESHFRGLYPGGIGNPFEGYVEDEVGTSGIPTRWLDDWTSLPTTGIQIAITANLRGLLRLPIGVYQNGPIINFCLKAQYSGRMMAPCIIFLILMLTM
jgi:hypothetical protein